MFMLMDTPAGKQGGGQEVPLLVHILPWFLDTIAPIMDGRALVARQEQLEIYTFF